MIYPQHQVAGSTVLRVIRRSSDQGSNTSALTRLRGRRCASETVPENSAPVATGYSCSLEHWLKLEGKDRGNGIFLRGICVFLRAGRENRISFSFSFL